MGLQFSSERQQSYLLMAMMSEAATAMRRATVTARPGEKNCKSTSSPKGHCITVAERIVPPARARASSNACSGFTHCAQGDFCPRIAREPSRTESKTAADGIEVSTHMAHACTTSPRWMTKGSLQNPRRMVRSRRPTLAPAGSLPSARSADTRKLCNLLSARPVTADPQTAVAVGELRQIR